MTTQFYQFDPRAWGKGFITHADWKGGLKFAVTGPIARVEGDKATADAWAARVKAEPITAELAAADLKALERAGLEAEIAEHQAEVSRLQVRMAAI